MRTQFLQEKPHDPWNGTREMLPIAIPANLYSRSNTLQPTTQGILLWRSSDFWFPADVRGLLRGVLISAVLGAMTIFVFYMLHFYGLA
jgi:hypothetical protein